MFYVLEEILLKQAFLAVNCKHLVAWQLILVELMVVLFIAQGQNHLFPEHE